jgi:hypothetical protein
MGPNEDPTPPPAQPSADLEHWLRDLRTEAEADPFAWDGTDAGEAPRPASTGETRGGGRHRAPE